MYENVWSGWREDVSGRTWDLTLDFNQETGLFRRGATLWGDEIEYDECADPIDAGLMEGPGAPSLPDDPEDTPPLIPAEVAEASTLFEGRFLPFGTPEDIVAGTWLSPADWPEARKAAASGFSELRGRCERLLELNLMDSMNRDTAKIETLKQVSQRLNAMFGGPDRWPRESVYALFEEGGPFYTRKSVYQTGKGTHRDPGIFGDGLPMEFMDAVVRTGSSIAGRPLGYHDAASAIVAKANHGFEPWESADSFEIVPSVDAARYVDQVKKGYRAAVTMSLSARFHFPVTKSIDLGTVEHVYMEPVLRFLSRQIHHAERVGGHAFDLGSLGVIELPVLRSYLDATNHGEIFSEPRGLGIDLADLGVVCQQVVYIRVVTNGEAPAKL